MKDDVPCPHRSAQPLGTVSCGCGGQRKVYRCDHEAAGPLVTRHAAQPRQKFVRLTTRLPDGTRRLPLDSFKIPACVNCPHRPGAPAELIELMGGTTPNPSGPAATREPCLEGAIASICEACPRISPTGQRFECPGPEVAACPLRLWPVVLKPRRVHKTGGCRGCG